MEAPRENRAQGKDRVRYLLLANVSAAAGEAMAAGHQRFHKELPRRHANKDIRSVGRDILIEESAENDAKDRRHAQGTQQRPTDAEKGPAVTTANVVGHERNPKMAQRPDAAKVIKLKRAVCRHGGSDLVLEISEECPPLLSGGIEKKKSKKELV